MMTTMLIYAYCVGVFSSRKMQRRLVEDVAFRVLAAGNQPDFRTISDFRKLHLEALEGLFQQVLRITLAAGMIKLGRVALDGSKVKANASKHKAMTYARMKETERRLRQEVRQLLEQAEAVDAEEDARYGRDRRGDELPAELARRETRIQRIREAKRALEERARAEAENEGESREEAKPKPKMQSNFTDPESRIMKGPEGFVQAYNTQIAVEPNLQLIVGQTVTQAENDKQQMEPLVKAIQQQSGQQPKQVLADSGYCSDGNLRFLAKKEDRRVRRHGKVEARRAATTLPTRAVTAGRNPSRADATQVGNPDRGSGLRDAEGDRRAGVRTNQTGTRLPAVSLAWAEEGAGAGASAHSGQQALQSSPGSVPVGNGGG
jgi:hypothetical protein